MLGQKSHDFCCLIALGMIRLMILLCFLKKRQGKKGDPNVKAFCGPEFGPPLHQFSADVTQLDLLFWVSYWDVHGT